jgi:hypothetical protein
MTERRHLSREELAAARELVAHQLAEVRHIMDGPSYDDIGADWPESYSELIDERDDLRVLLDKTALWNPTDEQLDQLGSPAAVLRDLLRVVKRFRGTGRITDRLEARLAELSGASY